MAKKGFTPKKIFNKPREAEVILNEEASIPVMTKRIGVRDATYYR